MLEYARHGFYLSAQVGPGNATRFDHLESVERQTGQRPAGLDGPELPDPMEHVWQWWQELHNGRPYGEWGPHPISYQDILAWSTLRHHEVTPFEVELLMKVDRLFLSELAKEREKRHV